MTDHISQLDEAYGKWIGKDRDAALRLALAILEGDPSDIGAMALVVAIVGKDRSSLLAGEVAARLTDAFVRRGDFASAVAMTQVAEESGEDAKSLREKVAAAFGKASPRVGDAPGAPPPLRKPVKISPAIAALDGSGLASRAETAFERFLATKDPISENSKLPALPLFGALAPDALLDLLGAATVRHVAMDEKIVSEGEEGAEAYVVVRGLLQVRRKSSDPNETEDTVIGALGPGAIFGEMALVSDSPRVASVYAVEPSSILVFRRDDLEVMAAKQPAISQELGQFCRHRMIANLMRTSPIMQSVPPAERTALMAKFVATTFEPGETLVAFGQETKALYVIASGHVRVIGRDADDSRIQLARLGPGDVVGEISVVLRRPATADVVAEHATVALELKREVFQNAIKEYPTLLGKLYDLATQRDEHTRSVVSEEAFDVDDVVLV